MNRPVRTFSELIDRLAKLREPQPGYTRVYRGQVSDFAAMLPTGMRPGAKQRDRIWHYYAMAVGRELSLPRTGPSDDASVWIEAIAQHYGPGSPLLDVTRSVYVALWFALHALSPVSAEHVVGPAGQPDDPRDFALHETWWEYRATNDGYFYVFDVSEWTGIAPPPHGALVDLSSQPLLSKSARIKAQAACLLAADSSIDGGDLRRFYACEPIPVMSLMPGEPRLNDSTETLFPDPSQDPWYDLFLSVPLAWQAGTDSRSLKLTRPLDVSSYFYSSRAGIDEILHRTKFIPLVDIDQTLTMNLSGSQEFRLGDAARILLEAPVLHWFLTYDADMWNQAILASDLSQSADAVLATGESSSVAIENVFLEFSPLENTDWSHLTAKAEYDVQSLRAVWLARDGSRSGVCLFAQRITNGEVKTVVAGPYLYNFNEDARFFSRRDPGASEEVCADWRLPHDKAFWVALAVLRFFSPVPKADPSPCQQSLELDGNCLMTIPIRGAIAKLVEVSDVKTGHRCYVPRSVETGQPLFPGAITKTVEVLKLVSTVPWSRADASYIRRLINERFASG